MRETTDTIVTGAQAAWATTLSFLPKLGLFLVILIAGYFIAKWIGKLVNKVLERVGFDRLVERGGIKRALDRTQFDASDIMCKIVFYTLFLFVLQLAFGVFGQNPISDILTRVIAFLPALFVALIIVVISSAIAKVVKDLLNVLFGNLSYGRMLANTAAAAVVVIGVFAALSHLQIAPAIVNGLFYAMLAIVAGSAIVAIGGGGIQPMREKWEAAMGRIEQEVPKLKAEAQGGAERVKGYAEVKKEQTEAEIAAAQADPRGPARYTPMERGRRES